MCIYFSSIYFLRLSGMISFLFSLAPLLRPVYELLILDFLLVESCIMELLSVDMIISLFIEAGSLKFSALNLEPFYFLVPLNLNLVFLISSCSSITKSLSSFACSTLYLAFIVGKDKLASFELKVK